MSATELDHIKLCGSNIRCSFACRGETHFVRVCEIAGCEHGLSVSFCDSRESGLMLVLLLCSGHMFPHSASAASETRRSCPGRKYTLRYDNDHNLYFRGRSSKYTDGH